MLTNPFVPDFNKRVRGMGVGEALNEDDAKRAREAWIVASYKAMDAARVLIDLDVDKSRINRLLEPWMWHTCITTSTEWGNFFGLRQPSGDGQCQIRRSLLNLSSRSSRGWCVMRWMRVIHKNSKQVSGTLPLVSADELSISV